MSKEAEQIEKDYYSAMQALYIALPESVVKDVNYIIETYVNSIKNQSLPKEEALSIKDECELMYNKIKEANERLKALRSQCKHENTFEGNYSYRIGASIPATICSDCGEVVYLNIPPIKPIS